MGHTFELSLDGPLAHWLIASVCHGGMAAALLGALAALSQQYGVATLNLQPHDDGSGRLFQYFEKLGFSESEPIVEAVPKAYIYIYLNASSVAHAVAPDEIARTSLRVLLRPRMQKSFVISTDFWGVPCWVSAGFSHCVSCCAISTICNSISCREIASVLPSTVVVLFDQAQKDT